jgi:Beta/Gamma crystallin
MAAAEVKGEIILFEHPNFRGAHRHIYRTEKTLNDPGNIPGVPARVLPALGQFDETTSSIIVVKGTWILYRNKDLEERVGDEAVPGAYPSVSDLHITGNTISSLELKSP